MTRRPPAGAPIDPAVAASESAVQRVLTLALHEENILNDRVNIFLLSQSLLLALVAQISAKKAALVSPVCILGLGVTLTWLLTAIRQWLDLRAAVAALREAWPQIIGIYAKVPRWLKLAGIFFMAVGLPVLFGVLWTVILSGALTLGARP